MGLNHLQLNIQYQIFTSNPYGPDRGALPLAAGLARRSLSPDFPRHVTKEIATASSPMSNTCAPCTYVESSHTRQPVNIRKWLRALDHLVFLQSYTYTPQQPCQGTCAIHVESHLGKRGTTAHICRGRRRASRMRHVLSRWFRALRRQRMHVNIAARLSSNGVTWQTIGKDTSVRLNGWQKLQRPPRHPLPLPLFYLNRRTMTTSPCPSPGT